MLRHKGLMLTEARIKDRLEVSFFLQNVSDRVLFRYSRRYSLDSIGLWDDIFEYVMDTDECIKHLYGENPYVQIRYLPVPKMHTGFRMYSAGGKERIYWAPLAWEE